MESITKVKTILTQGRLINLNLNTNKINKTNNQNNSKYNPNITPHHTHFKQQTRDLNSIKLLHINMEHFQGCLCSLITQKQEFCVLYLIMLSNYWRERSINKVAYGASVQFWEDMGGQLSLFASLILDSPWWRHCEEH